MLRVQPLWQVRRPAAIDSHRRSCVPRLRARGRTRGEPRRMPSLRQQEPGYSKRRARVTAAAPNTNCTLRFYGACCAVCGFRRGACATLEARARSRMPAASFCDASTKEFVAVADLTGLRSSRRARCDKLILSVHYSVNRAARRRRMPGVRDGLPGKDTRRKEELGTKTEVSHEKCLNSRRCPGSGEFSRRESAGREYPQFERTI